VFLNTVQGIHLLFAAPGFEWSVVWQYLFAPLVLQCVVNTPKITAPSMAVSGQSRETVQDL